MSPTVAPTGDVIPEVRNSSVTSPSRATGRTIPRRFFTDVPPVPDPGVIRLLLVRHAPTAATHRGAFPGDEPLDDDAPALASVLLPDATVLSSPALRCRQTAKAAGLTPKLEPRLAECDFGSWAGLTLAEVHAADPEAVTAWMTDPGACPHGGESLETFAARVSGWLDDQLGTAAATTVAFTHGGVIKAAMIHTHAAALASFWDISAAPLSVTELHLDGDAWTATDAQAKTLR